MFFIKKKITFASAFKKNMKSEKEIRTEFYARIEQSLCKILEEKERAEINPALILHDNIEPRPYSVEDFNRESFIPIYND